MAARKKTARKTTRKKTARKKASRKKAGRKKTTRKKAGRKKASRKKASGGSALSRLEKELPKSLRQLSKDVRSRLNRLEKDVEKTQARYRRQGARLLREASEELGRLEERGEKGWKQLDTAARKRVKSILDRLEDAVSPGRGSRRMPGAKTARKAVRRAQSGMRDAARTIGP